ncbi:BnaA04g25790D [Brassica napus]|uniref:(rape) hypothetical protein n=1 Tax=Brassica napus TaxID=3708 RepID=A0A078H0Y3_BRANA|nr:uncharacterized protein LOC125608378 [Brassica napus]CAF2302093.1 unnamed protein product [Brassica napus]CDY30478.1 BnaA04g25790D [Brassica napus]
MRCKRHTVDSSSTIGVCASCLRERLFSLAASEDNDHHHHHVHSRTSPPPPPLVFPRSVSPYAAARNSNAQGGGAGEASESYGGEGSSSWEKVFETNRSVKKKQTGLSRFSTLFGTDRSWFSKVLSPRSKTTTCYIEDLIASESNHHQHQPRHSYCKGMSPANELESFEDSPGRARRTPATGTPGRRKTATTTMGLCLSPLVRARPNCSFGYTGYPKSPVKQHISTATSFSANRSKKLADLGRADNRR